VCLRGDSVRNFGSEKGADTKHTARVDVFACEPFDAALRILMCWRVPPVEQPFAIGGKTICH